MTNESPSNKSLSDKQLSHQLSYLLRHAPHEAGLTLEPGGWVPLLPVLVHLRVTREQVARVVAASDKQRFSLGTAADTGLERIRANQGHSVPVDLELVPTLPPTVLYHGTYPDALPAIRATGLKAMNRHHVHLSPDLNTAIKVGARRGLPVVLTVQAGQMHAAGHLFYVSANGVWLTEQVPPEFFEFPSSVK